MGLAGGLALAGAVEGEGFDAAEAEAAGGAGEAGLEAGGGADVCTAGRDEAGAGEEAGGAGAAPLPQPASTAVASSMTPGSACLR